MFPNLNVEKRLRKKGYKIVGGIDEVGRGALAGPVVAVTILLKRNTQYNTRSQKNFLKEIKDSKKLTPKKREELFNKLVKSSYIEWGVGKVFQRVIDKINILKATKLAMKRSVRNLRGKIKGKIDFLILDGNFKIDLNIPQEPIKRADEKILSCACASILAKVTRDKIMRRLDQNYSNRYKFSKHKGYATKLHLRRLKKFGPCKIHRKSFGPVAISQTSKRK